MLKLAAIVLATISLAGPGCISPSGGLPISPGEDAGFPDGGVLPPAPDASVLDASLLDGSLPDAALDGSTDGSVLVDASVAAVSFSTGLGSGIVAHSAHFTLVTKTGTEPGGAGVRSSAKFKMISGVTK